MASKSLCCVAWVLMAATMLASTGEAMAPPTVEATPTPGACHCNEGETTVDCSNGYLDAVPTITCKTSRLLALNLSSNNLNVLERGAFEKLVLLQDLFLDNARIRLVHKDAFHNLKDLIKLDLSSNYIEKLHSETFRHLGNLQELHLGQNPLRVLPDNVFLGLKSLTTLDLKSCELESITEENFRSGAKQKTTLSNGDDSAAWPAGLYIDLGDNPLNCNCALKDLHDIVVHSKRAVQYDNLTCTQPEDLRGYPLHLLDSADLKCKPYEILFPLRNTTFIAPTGRNVTMSCRIANDPHLPWLKRWTFLGDASVVDEASPRFVISSSNLWLNLTIERVKPSDEGIYECQVYNREDRLRTYRQVSLVVFDELEYFTEHLEMETLDTLQLIGGVAMLGVFLSLAVFVLVQATRKSDVHTKKKTVFKKNRDVMDTVYTSSGDLLPSRPLPRRPGSEVLPWWLEYPEHLYEDVYSKHALAHPEKHTTQPGGVVVYDKERYVRPAVPREAEPSSQTTHTYTAVLPDEG